MELILGKLLGLRYAITSSVHEFRAFDGPGINYSKQQVDNKLQIIPSGLLYETGIRQQTIDVVDWEGMKVLFPTSDSNGFPFDIFAAGFYMVSRYEEYLPFTADEHGRFEAQQSIAFQYDFIEKPVVNYWALKLKEKLQDQFPELPVKEGCFNYISTIIRFCL